MIRRISLMLAPLPIIVGIAMPGAIGLTTTEVPFDGRPVLQGIYQRAYETAFTENLPLTEAARAGYTALTLALFNQAGPEVVIGDGDWLFTAEEFREPPEAVSLRDALAETRSELAAADITLIPVIVPDKARVYGDRLPRARSATIEARYDAALALLAEMQFPAADLAHALTAGRGAAETFMRTDTHWSPDGAHEAARALAASADLTAQAEVPFVTERAPATPFHGDLRPFVDTGALAPWIGPAPERISRPTTLAIAQDAGLFGDISVDAVLIGTSFSARPEFNFTGHLQQATGLTIINLAVEGQGPFAPMQAALANGAITSLTPTYVFWEIPERYIHARSIQ